ncbi:hypothetical protein PIB30_034652 [Stylosanthes scabra]|uniref:Bifunctional inhibitor/plant lipid transfer protein/seed storage helical domain-containing protein n=1 Tax=Stylosanthes scabra TaxID=79078 RepID=A0ABU6ZAK3_9FABA|nr:hypothetical protein [Stylosanthes scabra]
MKPIYVTIVLFLVVLVMFPSPSKCETRMECPRVVGYIGQCLWYLRSIPYITLPSQQCCEGLRTLASGLRSVQQKRDACNCVRGVLMIVNPFPTQARELPIRCGVQLPFPLSTVFECSRLIYHNTGQVAAVWASQITWWMLARVKLFLGQVRPKVLTRATKLHFVQHGTSTPVLQFTWPKTSLTRAIIHHVISEAQTAATWPVLWYSPDLASRAGSENNPFKAEFGAEVAGESERNGRIATKPRRPLLEPMRTHHMEPCVRIQACAARPNADLGTYAYAYEASMRTHRSIPTSINRGAFHHFKRSPLPYLA